jgi:hypothetical protein
MAGNKVVERKRAKVVPLNSYAKYYAIFVAADWWW